MSLGIVKSCEIYGNLAYNVKTMLRATENVVYEFAGFKLDVTRRRLLKNGEPLQLTSKALETLLTLVINAGKTLSKAELMDAVWGETAVEENNLTQQISTLRRALGERPDDHRFIVTVPGRGYSFVALIEISTVRRSEPKLAWWTRYVDADARRGYMLAAAYILLVAFSFLFQSHRQFGKPQSLAVLDFRASSTGDEFIGTGISDTLRARLGSVQDLVLRPGSPADQDAIALGRDLNVDAVVTGSVQRDHDRIRVAVQMVDVSAGRIIWGKTFDEAESNVFALQDSIAGEVAKALNVDLVRRHSARKPQLLPA
jgi:DNA-binding winged helix-turn-helix (wHTH) protein/TolB-like protein